MLSSRGQRRSLSCRIVDINTHRTRCLEILSCGVHLYLHLRHWSHSRLCLSVLDGHYPSRIDQHMAIMQAALRQVFYIPRDIMGQQPCSTDQHWILDRTMQCCSCPDVESYRISSPLAIFIESNRRTDDNATKIRVQAILNKWLSSQGNCVFMTALTDVRLEPGC